LPGAETPRKYATRNLAFFAKRRVGLTKARRYPTVIVAVSLAAPAATRIR